MRGRQTNIDFYGDEIKGWIEDFFLLLSIPTAMVFDKQPMRWQAAQRTLATTWHLLKLQMTRINGEKDGAY